MSARTAAPATATATARGGRSPARRGGAATGGGRPAARVRRGAAVRPPAAASPPTGRAPPPGRPAQHVQEDHDEDGNNHNETEDEPHVRHLSHTPVFPGSRIPASCVKGECPRPVRPKAHLRKSRGCPQDDAHERIREQRPPLPEPPPRGLRHDDLRGDVGAGRPHRFDQPRPGLPRHRRSRADRGGGLRAVLTGLGNQYPPGPASPSCAPRSPRTSSASTASATTRTPRSSSPRAPRRPSPPPSSPSWSRATRSSPWSRTTTLTRPASPWPARYASPSPCARTPEPSSSTWTNCAPPSPRAPACCS